jgi:hypothetical protein
MTMFTRKQRIIELEADNAKLRAELEQHRVDLEHLRMLITDLYNNINPPLPFRSEQP